MPYLFTYGTLRDERVQRAVLGRVPAAGRDVLAGYRRGEVPVPDAAVAARIGSPHYYDLVPEGGASVEGVTLEIRDDELAGVDAYEERDGFGRMRVVLASGLPAWAYAHHATAAAWDARSADDLRAIVERATATLLAISAEESRKPRAPGKWCPRQVVGHLVDSAVVNLQRFVRARSQGDLVFDGYDQDAWVAAQDYVDAPWPELVHLWRLINRHVARVIDGTPGEIRARIHARHSFDRIAFRTVRPGDPVTLDVLMEDYVAHLLHHVRQVLGAAWRAPGGRP